MSSADTIEQQQQLLATYRANLAHLLNQAAEFGGEDAVPVHIANQIHDQRAAIRACKQTLRALGGEVADLPGEALPADTPAGPKAIARAREPGYTKYVAIAGAAVAVASLILNVVLGVANLRLEREKAAIENQIGEIEVRNKQLDLLVKQREASVDLETRYLVATGLAMLSFGSSGSGDQDETPIVKNQVFQELGPWAERWSVGESSVVGAEGTTRAHGVVLFRVFNRSKQEAQRLTLTVRWKAFSQDGEAQDHLWDLKTQDWQETTILLADLPPGKSVIVPLAHVLGTDTFFGHVFMPMKLSWFNPTLQEQGSATVPGMAPVDQWISGGLNISVAQ